MNLSNQTPGISSADEKLARTFSANGRYTALFMVVTGVGFLAIYLLTRLGIFGQTAPQLLYISGTVFLLAVLQIPLITMARRGKGIAVVFLDAIFVTLFAILLAAFWEGIAPVSILIIFVAPLLSFFAGLTQSYYRSFFLLILAGIGGILYADANPLIDRLPLTTPAAVVSLVFLGTVGFLFVTVTVVARNKNFKSLRNQLLVSFLIIVTIPTLLATVLSAVGAYVNNESQVLDTLETITTLKESQINAVINNFKNDSGNIQRDAVFTRNITNLLAPSDTNPDTLASLANSARNQLVELQTSQTQVYIEIMVLNLDAQVAVSTNPNREGKRFESEAFFREGHEGDFAGFSKNPTFGSANLVFSTPLYDTDGSTVRGILVLRTQARVIKDIMESTPGFAEMETYLLDKDFYPITNTRTLTQTVHTQASENILSNGGVQSGRGTYENYTGDIVLGYYRRNDLLNAAFIAEVPRSYILQNSINSLLGSATLAIFAIVIAIAAVAISAASITQPIRSLVKAAENFAQGKLSARAAIDRRDEIGALGRAYDLMANQLQDIIEKLEQRVDDRTKELQNQTLRLRTAVEIARDAASSRNLSDLLNRAVNLIHERFDLYHAAIFLLDANHEFAIMAATSTPAGEQLIANNYKLRVGDMSLVGRAAATGESRIALASTPVSDITFQNTSSQPATRSEMALPIKVENRIIGVLHVQNDRPQAIDENAITVMQILADQLATAIERTRLLQQVEQNLSDLEQAYGQFTRAGWQTFKETGLLSKAGYRFDNVRIQPITGVSPLGDEALKVGATLMNKPQDDPIAKNQVAIPIKLRGQTIGVVTANLKEDYTQTTISTLELAIERLALSLESARLYEEARLRADREQAVAQISTNIGSSSEFDAILRTTVEEIGRSLGGSEVSIQIVSDTETQDQ